MAAPRPDMEQRQIVAELTEEGLTVSEIAAHLSVSERTVNRHRKALGLAHTPIPFTDEEHTRALEMLSDGCSLHEVATTLGRSYDTIMTRYKNLGWTKSQIGTFIRVRRLERQVFGG